MSVASRQAARRSESSARESVVQRLPVRGGEAGLVAALRSGHPDAAAILFDEHAAHVRRVLLGVLGPDPDLADLVQDVFVAALESIARLNDDDALRGWLTSIAVFKARALIRSRQRRRALARLCPWMVVEPRVEAPGIEISELWRATRRAMEALPADERIAFALRFIDGMELTEVADACGVSLATAKRRLRRAREGFFAAARDHAALREFLDGGGTCNPR